MSPGNPWNLYFPLFSLRVLPSMNFTSSQCLMHFFSFQRTFHHTRNRWILRILWSHACSFEFILFHTFSVFVLDNWFLRIFRRHEASVELRVHLEQYKNYFIEIASIFQSQKAKGSRLKPRKRTVYKSLHSFKRFTVYKFHHIRKRWILRILWSHAASSS